MLRATRKFSIMGVAGVNVNSGSGSNIGVSRDGGMVQATPLRKSDSNIKRSYHHMTNTFSPIKGTVLSHLLTSFATVLLVITISSTYNRQDIVGKQIPLARSGTIPRKMNLDNNERLLRRSIPSLKSKNMNSPSPFLDVTVVGSGPAGLTASLFAARAGLNVLVVGSETGLLSEATSLDNFPSWYQYRKIPTLSSGASNDFSNGGMTWLVTTKLQAAATGVHFVRPGLKVSNITKGPDNIFSLNISGIVVNSATVILATGATGRRLNVPNEELLWGKSIHSCAICDGPSYQNKSVVVVGGGDAAVDAAILLSRHARAVIVIHRRETFRASNQRNLKALLESPKMTVKTPFVVVKFLLEENATTLFGVQVRNTLTNRTENMECDGAFIMIGSTPNTQFLGDFVEVDNEGFIETPYDYFSESSTRTSVEGVFAAGEVTDKYYKQAITAAADGARAAIDAERWLRQQMPDVSRAHRGIPENIPLQSFRSDAPFMDQEKMKTEAEFKGLLDLKIECNDFTNSDCIKAIVDRRPEVMFSKSNCPYCAQALEVLKMEGVLQSAILVLNIDGLDEDAIRSNLESISGRRTVPNIFIGGRNIGGIVLMNRLRKLDELHAILEKANAIQRHKSGSDIVCNDFRRTECIEAAVHKYPVVVFSKTLCPYCKKALEALTLEGVSTRSPSLLVINLDELEAQTIQSNLARMTGRRTVPNVFIGGHSIGGGDETIQLQSAGELRTLLVNAKAIADS